MRHSKLTRYFFFLLFIIYYLDLLWLLRADISLRTESCFLSILSFQFVYQSCLLFIPQRFSHCNLAVTSANFPIWKFAEMPNKFYLFSLGLLLAAFALYVTFNILRSELYLCQPHFPCHIGFYYSLIFICLNINNKHTTFRNQGPLFERLNSWNYYTPIRV